MRNDLLSLFNLNVKTSYTLEELRSTLKNIDENELLSILEKLELDGKVYYDEETKIYSPFPSNFFVAKVTKKNNRSNDITISISGKTHHIYNDNSLKEGDKLIVSKNAKGKFKKIKVINNIINSSVSFETDIEKLFYPNAIGLTLENIKTALGFETLENAKAFLANLENENIIYFNQNDNHYYLITEQHIICDVEFAKKGLFIRINGEQIFLNEELASILLPKDKVICVKKNNNYEIISYYHLTNSSIDDLIKEEIKIIFNAIDDSITFSQIRKLIKYPIDENHLKELLKDLEIAEALYYDEEKNVYTTFPSNYLVVKVECTQKGLLYFNRDNKSYFPHQNEFNGARINDIIMFEKVNKSYRLVKFMDRFIKEIVCEVTEDGIRAVGNSSINVIMNKQKLQELNLPIGTRFLAIINNETFNNSFDVEYIKTLGHKNDLNMEMTSLAYNNGFVIEYTEEELKQAESMPKEVSEDEKIDRIDLTNDTIFTIDGESTKDIDDAVGIKMLENGNYELTVSIAAVAHYVKFKSPLWERAEKNTTSLYMINRVSHMLHPLLSNGICSLNPGVERLAKSFRMEIDESGKIIDLKIFDSIIKSRKKMTYEDINKILVDKIIPEGYEEFLNDILKMQELSQILTNRHNSEGSVTFDSREPKFIFDDNGSIIGIEVTKPGPAEKIIENFMVACNEAVAEYMLNLGVTFVYRNHEIPKSEKVLETIKLINSMGYHIEKLKHADDPHVIQSIIHSISTKEEFFILSSIFLRTMQKAYFSSENRGHFALALKGYSQTTSPIRRFLDLLIQYILDNLENGIFNLEEFKDYVDEMCKRASYMERCADKCEIEANKLYMVDYCAARPEQEYTAFIQEITPSYVLVKTPELIEGIIYLNDINEGGYIYNSSSRWLEHFKSKEKITIGEKITITLKDFNREYRLLYFTGVTPKRTMELKRKKRINSHYE